jgi:hypothetical protein
MEEKIQAVLIKVQSTLGHSVDTEKTYPILIRTAERLHAEQPADTFGMNPDIFQEEQRGGKIE